MSKITFFHCGDIHFDIPFTTLSNRPGLPGQRRQDIRDSFLTMIEQVRKEKPDFLFIAGDLFEHEYSNLRTMTWINERFCDIEETKVVMIAGNHDPEANNSFYKTMNWNSNVYYLGEESNRIYFEENNCEIFGIGFGPGYGQSIKLNDMVCETNRINVLLFHGDVDIDIGNRDYNAVSSNVLESKGFDYIALSHNHKFRDDYGKSRIIHNAGSLEALGFDEQGAHGFIKGVIDNKRLDTSFVSLGQSKYVNLKINVEDIADEVQLIELIKSKLSEQPLLYRIVLTGKKSIATVFDLNSIEKKLEEEVLFLRIKDETKIKKNYDDTLQTGGLRNSFIKKIKERMETDNEEEREILNLALIYGLQAIEEEKVETGIEGQI
ncbi:MAG: metallophosphoesterase [Clostridia bacterium]|nr:metallophosphoesterase [Clostridia bacterium]